jgi:hypothetical protein
LINYCPKSFRLSFYVLLRGILQKEAFWTFLERKSEENDKVSKSLLGTVPDGVKAMQVTTSRLGKEVYVENTHDGPDQFPGILA